MEEITNNFRRSLKEPSSRTEQVLATLSERRRGNVCWLLRGAPRFPAADIIFFGYDGGREDERVKVPELDVARVKSGVRDMNRTLGFGFATLYSFTHVAFWSIFAHRSLRPPAITVTTDLCYILGTGP